MRWHRHTTAGPRLRRTHRRRTALRPDNVGRQVLQAAGVLVALVVVGTVGYWLMEGWSLWDAFYMTMITITTVGYGEVHPLDRRGEVFTVGLLVGGVGAALYTLNVLVRVTMEGELLEALGVRGMRQRVERITGHIVLCGYGRVGEEIARNLARRGEPFVVVDNGEPAQARIAEAGYDHVDGDATQDETLRAAGIERARCLISALDSDAANCWVVLSARALNANLWVVARSDHPESDTRLRQAGADRVLSPPSIGGMHMALAAVQPLVLDFTQTIVQADGMDLMLAQVTVTDGSPLVGETLDGVIAHHPGLIVLALQRHNGQLVTSPDGGLRVDPGDTLIVLGTAAQLEMISGRADQPSAARTH